MTLAITALSERIKSAAVVVTQKFDEYQATNLKVRDLKRMIGSRRGHMTDETW